MKKTEEMMQMSIDDKIEVSKNVIRNAFKQYSSEEIAIAITGGKDSTTVTWLFKQVCDEDGKKMPRCMFIDEGDIFEEVDDFVHQLKKEWSLTIEVIKNDDVISKAKCIGGEISVKDLNKANRDAIIEFGYSEDALRFFPDSRVCNHLMKTLPMREFIVRNNVKAIATGIRCDEQTARRDEDFFSERKNPTHFRIHPILHFKERDIWVAIFKYDIPYNTLYRLGFRSLGARCATQKICDIPAWMQDLEGTQERAGRGQDKEQVMERLRQLGYM